MDIQNRSNYSEIYAVYGTPLLYVIDDRKIIIAKRSGPQFINDLLNQLELQKERFRKK